MEATVTRSAKAAVAKGIADILDGTATAESVLADVAVAAATTPAPEAAPIEKPKTAKQRAMSEPKVKAEPAPKVAKVAKPRAARVMHLRVVVSMKLDLDAYSAAYGETSEDELRAATEAALLSAITTPGTFVADPAPIVRDAHVWRKARRRKS